MKTISILLFFIGISFFGFSQDVILKRDGSKIEAKVIEITSTTIKYRNYDQENGPIRNIAKNDVEEIVYNDGSWEKFEQIEVEHVAESIENPRNLRTEKDHIFGNGFFLEGMLGVNSIEQKNAYSDYYYDSNGNFIEQQNSSTVSYASLSFRVGNKWYFGSHEKWRPGIQATYLKLGIYLNPNNGNAAIGRNSASLANVGFANAFKFNEKIGMETNLNVGFTIINFLPPNINYSPAMGINYGLEVKFRMKALAVGLDFSRMDANFDKLERVSMNVLSLTIGVKF